MKAVFECLASQSRLVQIGIRCTLSLIRQAIQLRWIANDVGQHIRQAIQLRWIADDVGQHIRQAIQLRWIADDVGQHIRQAIQLRWIADDVGQNIRQAIQLRWIANDVGQRISRCGPVLSFYEVHTKIVNLKAVFECLASQSRLVQIGIRSTLSLIRQAIQLRWIAGDVGQHFRQAIHLRWIADTAISGCL